MAWRERRNMMNLMVEFVLAQPVAACYVVFVAGVVSWAQWEGVIRPGLISKAEIDRIADDMITRYGPRAEEMAFVEEDRAWRHSETYEQGKWRRVRRELWRCDKVGE
jgi:hypothetical protein